MHFFFCFFLRFGKRGKKEERPWNADGRLRTRYLSAVPFVLRSDPRRPLSLRLFSLVVGVFSSSLPFLSNSSVLFSVQLSIPFRRRSSAFEIDFPPSGSIRNHLVNRRHRLAALLSSADSEKRVCSFFNARTVSVSLAPPLRFVYASVSFHRRAHRQ